MNIFSWRLQKYLLATRANPKAQGNITLPTSKQFSINSKDNILLTTGPRGKNLSTGELVKSDVIYTSLDSYSQQIFCLQEPKQNVKNHYVLLRHIQASRIGPL